MRLLLTILALTASLVALGLAMQPGLVAAIVGVLALPDPPGLARVLPVLLAVGGFMGVTLSVAGLWRQAHPPVDRGPWLAALEPVAHEHGREVQDRGSEGVGFSCSVAGDRVDVVVQPDEPGHISIWSERRARQALLIVQNDAPGATADDDRWHLVGVTPNWTLRAELPASARPLLSETSFTRDIDRLMSFREVRAIRHDDGGLEIVADLVAPEDVSPLVRCAFDAMRRMRVVNG